MKTKKYQKKLVISIELTTGVNGWAGFTKKQICDTIKHDMLDSLFYVCRDNGDKVKVRVS
jgi:hypothetical protein